MNALRAPRLFVCVAVLAAVALVGHGSAGAVPSGVPAAQVQPGAAAAGQDTGKPEDDARRGLHYGDLRRSTTAACRIFEMRLADGGVACTHGPDPAPAGVDVTVPAEIPSVAVEDPSVALATIPCQGDGSTGARVQLVYARAAGVTDRYASLEGNFRLWAAQVNDIVNQSAAETGGVRNIRFVHDAACQPTVLRVQLTNAGDDNLTNTINELRSQGYNRSDRKYLVWVDANVYCGIAQVYDDDRPTSDNPNNGRSGIAGMVARVDTGCWGHSSSVEAHELVHTLGSVQGTAPNATANGHCTDDYDRMCYADGAGVVMRVVCSSTSHEARLDCNHDDYFSTAPPAGSYLATHWNTANSAFLASGGSTPTTTTTVPPPTTTTTRPPTTTTTSTTRPPTTTTTTTRPPTTTTTTTVPSNTAQTLRFIDKAYRDVLGRPPSGPESGFWSNTLATGYSRINMAAALVTSDEYRRNLVNRYYQTYLGRPAPAADQDAYLSVMVNHGWPPEWVATLLLGGDEYYARSGGNPTSYVTGLYSSVLGLLPDTAGLTFWVNQLVGGLDRYSVALAFLTSGVARQNLVSAAYTWYLDRPVDTSSLDFWVGHLDQGLRSEFVAAFLVGSDEYWSKS